MRWEAWRVLVSIIVKKIIIKREKESVDIIQMTGFFFSFFFFTVVSSADEKVKAKTSFNIYLTRLIWTQLLPLGVTREGVVVLQ